jgi:hypothetical protein
MKTKTNYDKCKLNFKSKHKIEKSNIKTWNMQKKSSNIIWLS